MHAFDYEAPVALNDALRHLSNGRSTRLLAGGTDLIDQMRLGRHRPELVIDVKKIPELRVLHSDDAGLHVGAATPCYEICNNATVLTHYTALADSCRIIGGIQIQSRASIGGNLCNSGPAADSVPAMIALSGQCEIARADGRRSVPVAEFCTGPGQNVLEKGELLVEILFPTPAARSGSHYRRMIPRNEMDIAIVGVGASVTLDESGQTITDAKIGLGAVAPTPLVASDAAAVLIGQEISDDRLREAAAAAQAIVAPITDMRGTREYRVHATGVLVRRVLETAIARARGESPDIKPGS